MLAVETIGISRCLIPAVGFADAGIGSGLGSFGISRVGLIDIKGGMINATG
jgi:hypothetical protein